MTSLYWFPGFIKSYFDTLYDEEVVSEDSFNTWESSSEEQLGKGVAVAASSEFFRWLRSASEEPVEESWSIRLILDYFIVRSTNRVSSIWKEMLEDNFFNANGNGKQI